jgi:hypothetical protein
MINIPYVLSQCEHLPDHSADHARSNGSLSQSRVAMRSNMKLLLMKQKMEEEQKRHQTINGVKVNTRIRLMT